MTTLTNTSSHSEHADIREVDAETLHNWIRSGDAVLLDVREADEHAREHIPGSVLTPLSTLNPSTLPSSEGKKLVLHCRSGRRSLEAAMRLKRAGRENIHHLKGGLDAWRSSGLPLEENRRAPLPIMRQVQITAGSLIVLGTVLGWLVSSWWLLLSGFVGAGLVFAGISGTCGMASLLAKLPWNRIACDSSK